MSTEKSPLTKAQAITLLDRLIEDSAFRQEFQSRPADALAKISEKAAASASECAVPGELATIEDLAFARDRLIEHLTTTAVFSVPFCFVDGRTSN